MGGVDPAALVHKAARPVLGPLDHHSLVYSTILWVSMVNSNHFYFMLIIVNKMYVFVYHQEGLVGTVTTITTVTTTTMVRRFGTDVEPVWWWMDTHWTEEDNTWSLCQMQSSLHCIQIHIPFINWIYFEFKINYPSNVYIVSLNLPPLKKWVSH